MAGTESTLAKQSNYGLPLFPDGRGRFCSPANADGDATQPPKFNDRSLDNPCRLLADNRFSQFSITNDSTEGGKHGSTSNFGQSLAVNILRQGNSILASVVVHHIIGIEGGVLEPSQPASQGFVGDGLLLGVVEHVLDRLQHALQPPRVGPDASAQPPFLEELSAQLVNHYADEWRGDKRGHCDPGYHRRTKTGPDNAMLKAKSLLSPEATGRE
ncbi:hypothetical protein BHE74_00020468 [Ensete ventricosum]|nr:hypothetical protein BHE74_00020468 [Ensete ventricosum]